MSRIGKGKQTKISDYQVAKYLFFTDDNGKLHKTKKFQRITGYDKLLDKKKYIIKEWHGHVLRKDVTLSNNYTRPSSILSFKLFTDNETIISNVYRLIYKKLIKAPKIDILSNNDNLPKSRRIVLCVNNFESEDYISDYIIFFPKLYYNDLIQKIIFQIYQAVVQFIEKKNNPEMLRLFKDLYPDPYKPRAVFMNLYEVIIT